MRPAKATKAANYALVLSPKDEAMVAAFPVYRYLTARDLGALLAYSPKSLTHVRERLARLCGNQDLTDRDFVEGYPLLRFSFPTERLGNQERIYVLSATGRKIVESMGLPVFWHVKPSKLRTFSHSHLSHSLTLTRSVVAFHAWSRTKLNLAVEARLSYDLGKHPPVLSIPMQGKTVKIAVVPDALLLITNVHANQREIIVWEGDHNTESLPRLRTHIAARVAYVQSAHFKNIYGTIPFRIAYATQGHTPSASQARLQSLCTTTSEVLAALKKPEYARYFRFTTINFQTLYEDAQSLFEESVWYLPGEPATPVPLLTG
jgi:hypothetical protein